ncbi:hypothetical protein Tco_0725385 [Tanacetum coccineum]|uniref:Uncharacterized protein n=1 Tax=Tanacetum coccineum TaxID=301880 RepID=A0ABQ4YCR2_9ASTR
MMKILTPLLYNGDAVSTLWVPDEEKFTTEVNVILEWGSEQESEYSEEDHSDDDDDEVDWIYSDEDD